MLNEQHNNSGSASGAAGYTNISRATSNTFFPNWEHVHPFHDRLIKKTEVSTVSDRLFMYYRMLIFFADCTDWAKNLRYLLYLKQL